MEAKAYLRIAILMMQKNETLALPTWLKYHESLFGSTSIYLFDNGSTDSHVLQAVEAAEQRGVHVYRDHRSQQDFIDKGAIFTRMIQHLDATDPFDFYFPLDCDEFLSCLSGNAPDCSRSSIDLALIPFREHPGPLSISHKYWANPLHRNRYKLNTSSHKYFFARGSCGLLDHGFHHASSLSGAEEATTPIVYIEFHYKPYQAHRLASREKLLPFHGKLTRRSLREYAAKRSHSHHCAQDLLQSKFAYLSQFTTESFPIVDSTLLDTLDQLGAKSEALFESQPLRNQRLWQLSLILESCLEGFTARVQDLMEDAFKTSRHCVRRMVRGH